MRFKHQAVRGRLGIDHPTDKQAFLGFLAEQIALEIISTCPRVSADIGRKKPPAGRSCPGYVATPSISNRYSFGKGRGRHQFAFFNCRRYPSGFLSAMKNKAVSLEPSVSGNHIFEPNALL